MYVDDILVFVVTVEETLGRLELVLTKPKWEILISHQTSVNYSTRSYGILDIMVSEEGLERGPCKIIAITQSSQRATWN